MSSSSEWKQHLAQNVALSTFLPSLDVLDVLLRESLDPRIDDTTFPPFVKRSATVIPKKATFWGVLTEPVHTRDETQEEQGEKGFWCITGDESNLHLLFIISPDNTHGWWNAIN